MAVPSAGSLQNGPQFNNNNNKKKPKVRTDIAVGLTLLVFVAVYNSILKPTMHVVQEQHTAELPIRHLEKAALPILVVTVDSELLTNEEYFLKTIQSCIPNAKDASSMKKCGTYVPDQNGGRQRIAVLAPPGEMSNMMWHWVSGVVKQLERKQASTSTSTPRIELIRTSHVPPYGYGKTHGLTKIIRLVPKPLVLGVADALQQIIVQSESHHDDDPTAAPPLLLHQQDITLLDLKAVTRQFMRFHCRLSKVAAHTAIYSVNMNDFMDNYEEMTQNLLEFIQFDKDATESGEQEEEEYGGGGIGAGMGGGMDEVNLLSSDMSFVTNILTRIQSDTTHNKGDQQQHATTTTTNVKVLHVLDEVLQDELWKTKNLTNWPCESFWTVGEAHERTVLSAFAVRMARSFSPNCSAPFASCWVERDKCEAKGDGICSVKKKE